MKVFYFGCIGEAGHYLWSSETNKHYSNKDCPFENYELDCKKCPGWFDQSQRPLGRKKWPENQGQANLLFEKNFSILAIWDRTGDARHGSNSVFLTEGGPLSLEEIKEKSIQVFPNIWSRIELAGPIFL